MAAMYGSRWTSQHDGEREAVFAMGTWREALQGVTDEQVAAALEACVRQGGEWPPSLPSFRAMCVGVQGEAAERARQRSDGPDYLSDQRTREERRGTEYEGFRAMLKEARSRMAARKESDAGHCIDESDPEVIRKRYAASLIVKRLRENPKTGIDVIREEIERRGLSG